jgi:hypothetical protein
VVGDTIVTVGLVVGFDVNGYDNRRGELMAERMFNIVGDVMAPFHSQLGIDSDRRSDTKLMTVPTYPEILDGFDTVNRENCLGRFVNDLRLYTIDQTSQHEPGGLDEQPHDRYRDDESSGRVDPSGADGCPDSSSYHSERCECIGSCMTTIGDERLGSNRASDPNAISGNELVSERTDETRSDHPRDVVDQTRLKQPLE